MSGDEQVVVKDDQPLPFAPMVRLPKSKVVLDCTDISWFLNPQLNVYTCMFKGAPNPNGPAFPAEDYQVLIEYMASYGLLRELKGKPEEPKVVTAK